MTSVSYPCGRAPRSGSALHGGVGAARDAGELGDAPLAVSAIAAGEGAARPLCGGTQRVVRCLAAPR